MKEQLEKLILREVERLANKELLTDEDLARIPQLARAAEIVQGLRAGKTDDARDAAALEALTHGS